MTLLEQIILIYPIYIIGVFFAYTFYKGYNKKKDLEIEELKNKVNLLVEKLKENDILINDLPKNNDVEKIEENINDIDTKVDKLDKKLDTEINNLKNEIKRVDESLQDRIKRVVNETLNEKSYLSALEKDRLNMEILRDSERRMFDLDVFDKKIERVMNDVMDIHFKNVYFGNPTSYDLNTGIFKMPDITQASKRKDIEEIYARFMNVINKQFLINDLSMIYDMEQIETKVFLIERYIINEYTARIEKMIEDWQDTQKKLSDDANAKRIAEERNKAIRKAEEERQNSELGQLENKIDAIFNTI